jgi:hypothetical protein
MRKAMKGKSKRSRRNMKTVKLTPKWGNLVPYFCRVLQDRSVPQNAKTTICVELKRLADFADEINAQVRKGK